MPPDQPPKAAKRSRLRKILLALSAVSVAALLAIRFILVPVALNSNAVKGALQGLAEQTLGCEVEVGTLRVSGLVGTEWALDSLSVHNPEGFSDCELLTAKSIRVRPGWTALAARELVLHELEIGELLVRIERNAQGQLNLDWFAQAGGAPSPIAAAKSRSSRSDKQPCLSARAGGAPSQIAAAKSRSYRGDKQPCLSARVEGISIPHCSVHSARMGRVARASGNTLKQGWQAVPVVWLRHCLADTVAARRAREKAPVPLPCLGVVGAPFLLQSMAAGPPLPFTISAIKARILDADIVLASVGDEIFRFDGLRVEADLPSGSEALRFRIVTTEPSPSGPAVDIRGEARIVQEGRLLALPPTIEFEARVENLDAARLAGFFGLAEFPAGLPPLSASATGIYDSASGSVRISAARLAVPGAEGSAAGTIDLSSGSLSLQARAEVRPGELPALKAQKARTGRLALELSASGPIRRPEVKVTARSEGLGWLFPVSELEPFGNASAELKASADLAKQSVGADCDLRAGASALRAKVSAAWNGAAVQSEGMVVGFFDSSWTPLPFQLDFRISSEDSLQNVAFHQLTAQFAGVPLSVNVAGAASDVLSNPEFSGRLQVAVDPSWVKELNRELSEYYPDLALEPFLAQSLALNADPEEVKVQGKGSLLGLMELDLDFVASPLASAVRKLVVKGKSGGHSLSIIGRGDFGAAEPEGQVQLEAELSLPDFSPLLPVLGLDIPGSSVSGTVRSQQVVRLVDGQYHFTGSTSLDDAGLRIALILPVALGSPEIRHSLVYDQGSSSVELKGLTLKPKGSVFPLSLEARGACKPSGLEIQLSAQGDLTRIERQFGMLIKMINPIARLQGEASFQGWLTGPGSSPALEGQLDLTKSSLALSPFLQKGIGDRLTAEVKGTVKPDGFALAVAGQSGQTGTFGLDLRSAGLAPDHPLQFTLTLNLPTAKRRLPFPGSGGLETEAPLSLRYDGRVFRMPLSRKQFWQSSELAGRVKCGPGRVISLAEVPLLDQTIHGIAVRLLSPTAPDAYEFESVEIGLALKEGIADITGIHADGKTLDAQGKGHFSVITQQLELDLTLTPEKALLEASPPDVREAFRKEPNGSIPVHVTGTFSNPKPEYQVTSQPLEKLIREALDKEAGTAPALPPAPPAP